MADAAALPSPKTSLAAVIVAAGQGLRAGQPVPKQFANWRGKPVVRHSAEALLAAGASPLIIAIPEGSEAIAREALGGLEPIVIVTGGASRQQSVINALDLLETEPPEFVLIHDAARPGLSPATIATLLGALAAHPGAVPVLPVVDSIAIDCDGLMAGTADRETLRRVQTPQAFRYSAILAAHRAWSGTEPASDDAQVLRAAGGAIAHVPGDEALHKLTFAEDFMVATASIRTGMGFDVHRLVAGEELWLGGVRIEHERGLAGHSDADVALHAIVDALLGAIAAGDIGDHFPPSDPRWKGASSSQFVEHANALVRTHGFGVSHLDLTIICEAPRIGPYKQAMRCRIAELLGIDSSAVSVKATTTEGLGLTGRGEGIAAQAVVTIAKEG